MRQLAAMQVRSVLLTSGTLSPLDSFAHELQLPFRISLENPHVIDPSQVRQSILMASCPVDPALSACRQSPVCQLWHILRVPVFEQMPRRLTQVHGACLASSHFLHEQLFGLLPCLCHDQGNVQPDWEATVTQQICAS